MTTNLDLALRLWVAGVLLLIGLVTVCCIGRRRLQDRREDEDGDDDQRHQEPAAAAPHAQPAAAQAAAAVQIAAVAVALLDHVSYPLLNVVGDDHDGGGGDHDRRPLAPAAEECAICLGRFEDGGDWCSVMPVCCHEFHRSCIAKWLAACNNTCPLCRAQLQWDVVAQNMV